MSEANALPRRRRRRRSLRRLQVVIEYRGGATCSYVWKATGVTFRYTGDLALHDVFSHFVSLALPTIEWEIGK